MQLSLLGPIDRWFAPAPATRLVDWLRGASFAHRGVHGGNVVENSRSAFAEALARGLGIECDVQKSGDGEAVVFHDFELDRLTGESGKVSQRSSAQLTATVLSGTTDTIQTLRQMLDQVLELFQIIIMNPFFKTSKSSFLIPPFYDTNGNSFAPLGSKLFIA